MPAEPDRDRTLGQEAISLLVDKWFAENTYHADEFADLDALVALKRRARADHQPGAAGAERGRDGRQGDPRRSKAR